MLFPLFKHSIARDSTKVTPVEPLSNIPNTYFPKRQLFFTGPHRVHRAQKIDLGQIHGIPWGYRRSINLIETTVNIIKCDQYIYIYMIYNYDI